MKKNILALFVLIALTLLCYGQSMNNHFFLDDNYLIVENGRNLSQLDFEGFFKPYPGSPHIRPVGTAIIHYAFPHFGADPSKYRVINVVSFILCSFLLFLFIRRITSDFDISLLTAALFCVHPINTVVINFVTTHIFTLFACCALLTLLFLDYYRIDSKKSLAYVLFSYLFYVLSSFCHPIAVIVPIVVFGFLFLYKRFTFLRCLCLSLPYLITLAAYLYLRLFKTGMGDFLKRSMGESQFDWMQYAAGLYDLYLWFIQKLFIPTDMTFINNILVVSGSHAAKAVGLLCLLGAFIWTMIYFKRDVRSFAVYWFGCGFLLVASSASVYGFLGLTFEMFWFIFNVMGFFLLAAILMKRVKKRFNVRIYYLLSVLVILILCVHTRDNNLKWKNEKGYFQYLLKHTPDNALALLKLGDSYKREGAYDQAVIAYHQLLNTTYGYKPAEALSNIAKIYNQKGDYSTEAYYYYRTVVSNDPCEWCAFSYIEAYISASNQFRGFDINDINGVSLLDQYESNPYDLGYALNLATYYLINHSRDEQYLSKAIDVFQQALNIKTNSIIREYIYSSLIVALYINNESFRAESYIRQMFDEDTSESNNSSLDFLYNTFIRFQIDPEDQAVINFINPIIGDSQ